MEDFYNFIWCKIILRVMKKILFCMVFFLAAVVFLQAQEKNSRIYSEAAGQEILIGQGDRSGMEEEPFREWFDKAYEEYATNDSLVRELAGSLLKEMEVTVVLGTWCSDSRREVPRFFKVADAVGIPGDHITVIYVDRDKRAPGIDTDALEIERVPTFIFYLDGLERGRIVEVPAGSFEEEMYRIMKY